jgi:hypothetical protein
MVYSILNHNYSNVVDKTFFLFTTMLMGFLLIKTYFWGALLYVISFIAKTMTTL